MSEIERIKFKAKSISKRLSLGDNEPVKLFELETLENSIREVIAESTPSDEAKKFAGSLLEKINDLKSLKSSSFNSKAMVLGGLAESFCNAIEDATSNS